jgi:hypothetical protein
MKFLVFIVIVVSLWYVMRWIQIESTRRMRDRGAPRQDRQPRQDESTGRQRPAMRATDMTACPRCGSYVPSEFPVACGRRDCPYPGVG